VQEQQEPDQQPDEGESAPATERPWTKDQFDRVADDFIAERALVCPNCASPLLTRESPGPKRDTIEVAFMCPQCRVGASAPFWRYDPNIFIHPPYLQCSKCGQDEFGVLYVNGDSYGRRCRNRACQHIARYHLPRLKKKVIYIDQSIISDMVKALHPATESDRRERVAYARRVFAILDRAVKLQLVICPDSPIHMRESMVAADFKALERMYELLSHKVTFRELWDIEIAQVIEHAVNWLHGEPSKPAHIDALGVVRGDLHGWHDRIMFDVPYHPQPETIAAVRSRRDHIATRLTQAFKDWASFPDGTFASYRADVTRRYGRDVVNAYAAYRQRSRDIAVGLLPPDEENHLRWPLCTRLAHRTRDAFERDGLTRQDAEDRTWEYFTEADHSNIPFVHLKALLHAALAWQYANGRSSELDQGTTNDLAAVQFFLPYCDAMYLDNPMHALLADQQVSRELGFGARIFSKKTCDVFVTYIEEIIANASTSHLALVRSVYGDKWGKAFTSMYEPRKS
jgi:hypothetical protein